MLLQFCVVSQHKMRMVTPDWVGNLIEADSG